MNFFSMSLEILLIINVVIIVLGYIGFMKIEREIDRETFKNYKELNDENMNSKMLSKELN